MEAGARSVPRRVHPGPPTRPAAPRSWHQADTVVTAPTWGGSLEILHWNLAAGRWILPNEAYAGCVLLLETSEERPGDLETETDDARDRYRTEQRDAVLRALSDYNPGAMAVFGVDFGHTSPQWVLPFGGRLTVDGPGRRIIAHY